jgi:hypothetical protein
MPLCAPVCPCVPLHAPVCPCVPLCVPVCLCVPLCAPCVQGGADRHVAYALLGRVGESLPSFPLHPSYLAHLVEFEGKVKASVLRLSCIQGIVLHHWHGKLRHRKVRFAYRVFRASDWQQCGAQICPPLCVCAHVCVPAVRGAYARCVIRRLQDPRDTPTRWAAAP